MEIWKVGVRPLGAERCSREVPEDTAAFPGIGDVVGAEAVVHSGERRLAGATIAVARDATPAASPVAIDGLFGWFTPGTGRRGVVLCGTHGFEQLRAHRSWRDLAERIAGTGCPVLRFDYPGEGDSADLGAGRVPAFVGAIRRAIRYLREDGGVEEIALVGLRLGATLAALAAREGGVDRLVLLAPFATGRAYLREMTIQSRMIDRLSDGTPHPREASGLRVGGYRLDPAFVADLSAIDLTAAGSPPVDGVLILGAGHDDLAARYAAGGCAVAVAPFPDLARLIMKPSGMPEDAFSAIVDFVADGAGDVVGREREEIIRSGGSEHDPQRRDAPARCLPTECIAGAGWSEAPMRFGPGLFGVFCRPREPASAGPVFLFLNAGTDVHSGYGRQTTTCARQLAKAGLSSLRFDLRGIGDSGHRPDGTSPLYTLDALDEVHAALDQVRACTDGPIVVVGTCSGAYLAFHAACQDPRIEAALLINLYCFDWNPVDDVEAALHDMVRSVPSYARLMLHPSAWRRTLWGEVRVAAILSALVRAGLRRLTARRAPGSGSATADTVVGNLAALRQRGVRIRFVYGAGEPGLARVRAQLGRSQRQTTRGFVILDGADHNLTTDHAQSALLDLLLDLGGELASHAPTKGRCGKSAR